MFAKLIDKMKMSLQWTGISWCLMCLVNSGLSMLPNKQMKIVHEWKSLEFDFPNEAVKSSAIRSGDYIPGAAVPIDVDAFERGLILIFSLLHLFYYHPFNFIYRFVFMIHLFIYLLICKRQLQLR